MAFNRQERANVVLAEQVAAFIREEANSDPLITVIHVDVSANHHDATVFFTTLPDSKENDALAFLKRKGTELREYLKKNARLKFIPQIHFEIDHGERHRQHIDEVARKINKK